MFLFLKFYLFPLCFYIAQCEIDVEIVKLQIEDKRSADSSAKASVSSTEVPSTQTSGKFTSTGGPTKKPAPGPERQQKGVDKVKDFVKTPREKKNRNVDEADDFTAAGKQNGKINSKVKVFILTHTHTHTCIIYVLYVCSLSYSDLLNYANEKIRWTDLSPF